MSSQPALPAASFADALAALDSAVAVLAGLALWSVRDVELLAGVERVAVVSARLDAVSAGLLREADERGAPQAAGAANVTAWLRGALRIAPGAAHAQAQLAQRLASPRCARTAAVFADGAISTGHAQVITRTLASLPESLPPDVVADAETMLLEQASRLDPTRLRYAATHLRAVLDPGFPDALARTEFERVEQRSLTVSDCGDGWFRLVGQLDPEGATVLQTALGPLAAPRPSTEHGPDPRRPAQRRADALVELARRALTGGDLPAHGGVRPTLVVTMDYEQLVAGIGTGRVLDSGLPLSPETVRRLACDARIIPAVLGGPSEVLDLGRGQYRASAAQRLALALRDGGCANPACGAPPSWCDVHHTVPFAVGGRTDLDDLALLCPRDHTRVHAGELVVSGRPGAPPIVTWVRPELRRRL